MKMTKDEMISEFGLTPNPLMIPPWCHGQGIPGTGPGSKERACIRCRFRESCGEVD